MKSSRAGCGKIIGRTSSTTTNSTPKPASRSKRERMSGGLPAEKAGRFDHQNERHYGEHQAVHEPWKADGTEGSDEPDQQRRDEGAGDRTHAAEHRDDET